MMKPVKFIENETGIEVLISTQLVWGNYEKTSNIQYPSGAVYSIPDREVSKHFTMVRPQEVFIEAFGAVHERPTKWQAEIDAERSPPLRLVQDEQVTAAEPEQVFT